MQRRRRRWNVSETLRRDDHKVTTHCGGGALKKQLKRADQSGAKIALIAGLGDDENVVQVKPLRGQNQQQEIAIADLAAWCDNHLTEQENG